MRIDHLKNGRSWSNLWLLILGSLAFCEGCDQILPYDSESKAKDSSLEQAPRTRDISMLRDHPVAPREDLFFDVSQDLPTEQGGRDISVVLDQNLAADYSAEQPLHDGAQPIADIPADLKQLPDLYLPDLPADLQQPPDLALPDLPKDSCIPNCTEKCAGAPDECGGTCLSTTCSGCCKGTICKAGFEDTFCGSDGDSCQMCVLPKTCISQTCTCIPINCTTVCKGTSDGCGGICTDGAVICDGPNSYCANGGCHCTNGFNSCGRDIKAWGCFCADDRYCCDTGNPSWCTDTAGQCIQ